MSSNYEPYLQRQVGPFQRFFNYFKAIWDTVISVLMGLHITAIRTWFLDPKQTIHYPDVDITTGRLRTRQRQQGLLRKLFITVLRLDGNRVRNLQAGYVGKLRPYIANRYRGILNVDTEICTACLACEKACPIDCIQIIVEKDPDNPKVRLFQRFDIDLAKCMYCGLCSEPCPTGAIYHTKEFAHASPDFPDFIRNFVHPTSQSIYKVKKSSPETIEV